MQIMPILQRHASRLGRREGGNSALLDSSESPLGRTLKAEKGIVYACTMVAATRFANCSSILTSTGHAHSTDPGSAQQEQSAQQEVF
jgi:hypothetical protein